MTHNESFDRAIERLLSDQSPRAEAPDLDDEERDMLRMAQLLRGSRDGAPTPEFVERLHDELAPPARRVSRRTAFLSGFGAMAAGLLGGIGIEKVVTGGSSAATSGNIPLVSAKRGSWVHVANVADVPPGAVQPFSTGALTGVLINSGGNLRAMSTICTHMGCALRFVHGGDRYFSCPCHGAEFDLSGKQREVVNYRLDLPALPPIHVRVNGKRVEIFGV
jgi:nitrite reductase/ring-hydroxylating ferredoxin subunit